MAELSPWPQAALRGLLEVLPGFAFDSAEFTPDPKRGMPLIRIRDLRSTSTTLHFVGKFDRRYLVRNGDTIVGMDGDFEIARWRGSEALLNQRVCRLRALATDRLCDDFVLHRLEPELRRLHGGTGATTVKHLSTKQIEALEIPLPPLAEQRKIAAILSSVDETIEKTEAVIAQLDVVKMAMLEELLTRGIPGRHSRFKQTEIGEVPADWEVHQVGQLGEVQTGLAKNKNNRVQHVDEVPYLSVANVQDGWLDLDHVKRVRADAATIERFRLRVGDVLFCEGGDADKVGRGAVWSGGLDPCLHQNHVFVVRPDSRRLLPEFLSAFRASSRGRRYFLDCSKQTTNLASINSSQLRAMPLALPSVAEQAEIVRAVDSIERRCSAERDCLGLLVKSKAALSSALLSGEVRTSREAGVECS
jgi:type I restriction enzyme S subunit